MLTDNFETDPKPEPLDCSPIPGDLVVYRASGNAANRCQRCLIESIEFRQGRIAYNVRLLDEDRSVSASRDALFRSNDKCVFACPRLLRCVMAAGAPTISMADATSTLIVDGYDAVKDVYSIGVMRPVAIAPHKPLVTNSNSNNNSCHSHNNSFPGFVSHVESCTEFYVQKAPASALDAIIDLVNGEYRVPRFATMRELNVNQIVVAPFLGVNYRALVKELDSAKAVVRVFFIDFGNSEWVELGDILQATEEVMRATPLAHRCRLAVAMASSGGAGAAALELLKEFCGNGEVELAIEVLADDGDVWTVDLCADGAGGGSFVAVLREKKLTGDSVVGGAGDGIVGGGDTGAMMARLDELEARISLVEKLVARRQLR